MEIITGANMVIVKDAWTWSLDRKITLYEIGYMISEE